MILAPGIRHSAACAGFQWTRLKIDRAFISHMDSDPESREIVRIIIMLAHNLGLKVVAEGTETEEHINLLKQLNCEMAQGYFFSRPADDQAMLTLLGTDQQVVPLRPVAKKPNSTKVRLTSTFRRRRL